MDSKIRFSNWIEKVASGNAAIKDTDTPEENITKLIDKSGKNAAKVSTKMDINTKLDKLFK